MYVSLMGKMGSYLDVANERKELARSALTTEKKRGLRRHFDTEAEFSTWVAGVEGDAWGDLLTLHHIAMTWSLTILVVQPGACPMVVVNRERQSKKKTQKKKPREVRVISLIGEHYEQVQMDPAQASALANAAPIAELIPSRLAVSPIPGMTKDATSPLEGDSPLLYCPVPCCQGSRFHRDIPLSGPGLRAHIAGHLAEGDHIPHDTLRKFGLGQCGVCDGIRAAKNETCLQCSRLVQAVPRPSPTIRTPAQEVDDRDMPDWYEIAAAPIPTHDTVPKAIDRAAAVEFAKGVGRRSWLQRREQLEEALHVRKTRVVQKTGRCEHQQEGGGTAGGGGDRVVAGGNCGDVVCSDSISSWAWAGQGAEGADEGGEGESVCH